MVRGAGALAQTMLQRKNLYFVIFLKKELGEKTA